MMQGLTIIQYPDSRFCLTVMEPSDETQHYWDLFEEHGLQGGGYTWQGIIESLVRMCMPGVCELVEVGAEADNAYVVCRDRAVIESLSQMIEEAIRDRDLLKNVIENAEDLE